MYTLRLVAWIPKQSLLVFGGALGIQLEQNLGCLLILLPKLSIGVCMGSQLQTPIEMSTKNLLFKKHNYLRKKTAKRLSKEIPTVLRRNWQQQPVTI